MMIQGQYVEELESGPSSPSPEICSCVGGCDGLPGGLARLVCTRIHNRDSSGQKDLKQKEKTGETESGRNRGGLVRLPDPVESHRTCLTPLAMSCDNMYQMLSTREAHKRLSSQRFFSGAVHGGSPYLACIQILESLKESRCTA